MKLLPYTSIDGIPTFADSFIRALFERMEKEGLVGDTFYDGSAKTPDDFLNIMKFGANRLFVIEFRGEISGVTWLNNFQMRSAECHFCFFSNLRGSDALDVGREIVHELINMKDSAQNNIFDIIIGITPVDNKAAIRWTRRMGFGIVGVMPKAVYDARRGESVSAQICYIERSEYGQGRN